MVAVVQKDSQSSRYYLHEVITNITSKKTKKKTLVSESDGTSAFSGDLDTVSDAKASKNNISNLESKNNTPKELQALRRKQKEVLNNDTFILLK